MNELIGINEYLTLHDGWENRVRTVDNREKAYFYLEDHDYFGIEKIDAGDIVFEKTGKNPYYIYRRDIPFLDEQMEKFFLTFGLSEEEKFKLVINLFDEKETLSWFADYLEKMDIKVGQPAVVETAWLLAELPDELINMKNEDVVTLLQLTKTKVCKRILRDFANWLRQERDVEYGHLLSVKQESEPVQAYTVEEYHEFSICVFNEEQIKENHMIEKALKDIRYVGMWTYHTRARGYACPHDVRGSCETADCKCNILTKDILPTLVKIIKEKQLLADAGDTKAKAVLEQRLKPKFKQAMKCLKGVLSKQEMQDMTPIGC